MWGHRRRWHGEDDELELRDRCLERFKIGRPSRRREGSRTRAYEILERATERP